MFGFGEKRRSLATPGVTVGKVTVTDLNEASTYISSDRLSMTSESAFPSTRSFVTNENHPTPGNAHVNSWKFEDMGGCLAPWFLRKKRAPISETTANRSDKRRSSEIFGSLPKVMLDKRRYSEIGGRPSLKTQTDLSTTLPDRQRINQSASSPQLSILGSKNFGFQGELRKLRDVHKTPLLNFNDLQDKVPPYAQQSFDVPDTMGLRAELRRWKLKGCAKNVAFSLQARELSGMMAAAMVNYDEDMLTSFEQIKRCLTSTFTKHFVNGYVLSSATEEDASELVKLVMNALQEEDGIGFCLGLRVSLRAFVDNLIDLDLDE